MVSKQINYVELPSSNLIETKRFFKALLDWDFVDYGEEYSAFNDGHLDGGFYFEASINASQNNGALIVFYSENLEKSLNEVESLGASITKPIFTFPGGRRFHFVATDSIEFAIWSNS